VSHPYLFFTKITGLLGLDTLTNYPHIVYSWVVMALLVGGAWLLTRNIQLVPEKGQNFLELFVGGIEEFMVTVTGEEGRRFFPILGSIFIYIAACNLIGLVPGFFPPTASINTTLSCAVVVFVATHTIGIMYHGPKYIKHFLGPVWWMIPIILPIEIIGHLARVLSLTFRLFGNMMGHELVLLILFFLAGAFFAPLPIMALGIFVAVVQAFVFFLLSTMYFAGSMEHAH
jgi:F-type H+-transporting ATPase subunit a